MLKCIENTQLPSSEAYALHGPGNLHDVNDWE